MLCFEKNNSTQVPYKLKCFLLLATQLHFAFKSWPRSQVVLNLPVWKKRKKKKKRFFKEKDFLS